MTANDLDLEGWKRRVENSRSGQVTVTALAETDTAFTAQAKCKLPAHEAETWLRVLQAAGTAVTGVSQDADGTVTAAVRWSRIR
ncbi:hypothetical protein [Amycolatopsis sp. NPDC004079]|uniref:hypothetical protein n=1 Tax=Amycolatopsis sp. NPDC004079 TaxID=3154549 RepID=UPI0033B7BA79